MPRRAVHPKDSFKWGTLCRKKSVISNISTKPDFVSSHLSLIGYCGWRNKSENIKKSTGKYATTGYNNQDTDCVIMHRIVQLTFSCNSSRVVM